MPILFIYWGATSIRPWSFGLPSWFSDIPFCHFPGLGLGLMNYMANGEMRNVEVDPQHDLITKTFSDILQILNTCWIAYCLLLKHVIVKWFHGLHIHISFHLASRLVMDDVWTWFCTILYFKGQLPVVNLLELLFGKMTVIRIALYYFSLWWLHFNKISYHLHSTLCSGPSRGGERGESFPGPRDVWGAPPSLKNIENGVPRGFFLT